MGKAQPAAQPSFVTLCCLTVEQQRELADALRMTGNSRVSYYELGGVWGHDTFLLDEQNVGGAIRGFLD